MHAERLSILEEALQKVDPSKVFEGKLSDVVI